MILTRSVFVYRLRARTHFSGMAEFEICTLASGSKGNCLYVKSGSTSLLIDEGLTVKELQLRARLRDIDLSQVDAVLVTHEHSDHVKGVEQFSRAYQKDVYMPQSCFDTLNAHGCAITRYRHVDAFDGGFDIGDIKITPFRLPHDARYTVGYRLSDGKCDIAVATDLGFVSDNTLAKLCGCKAVVIESNHDRIMLEKGRYPYALKVRIASKNGHLSNDDSAQTCTQLAASGTQRILLAHLSEDNNTPELAFQAVRDKLMKNGIKEGEDVLIDVATQFKPSEIIKI